MSDALLDELTEEVVFQVRQSRAVQLARIEAYIDAVVLAAEQVQDTRIRLLEEPVAVSGWEAAGSILLSFALDSTIAGKLLAKAAQVIFTPVLRMNSVFRALPKSADGQRLMDQARRLARMNEPAPPSGRSRGPGLPAQRIYSGRAPSAQTFGAVLQGGAGGQPGLKALGKENVVLYHAWLEAVVQGGSSAEKNLTAVAKAMRQAANTVFTAPPPSATDSPAVALRAAAYEYASVTRLGVQVQHDRFETLVRGGQLEPAGLGAIVDLCAWQELDGLALGAMRRDFALLFEAIIWARLYGFKRPLDPRVTNNETYLGIDERLSEYWFARFATLVAPRIGLTVPEWWQLSVDQRLFRLRDYFWVIIDRMPRL
jgi:hypothetical protein